MQIEIKLLDKSRPWYPKDLPTYAKPGDAGMDLRVVQDITIMPGETCLLPTGLAIWIGSDRISSSLDMGVMGMVVPRSGLGTKGLVLANTVGIIDEGYQNEIKIAALNRTEEETFYIEAGDRIAQLIFVPVIRSSWKVVEEFSNLTERNVGGFNSTGVK